MGLRAYSRHAEPLEIGAVNGNRAGRRERLSRAFGDVPRLQGLQIRCPRCPDLRFVLPAVEEPELVGAGDILVPRDNTVAAALKFMTEAILFEMFTHRKPTLNDLYLIHQQGVDGAAEHVSHPHRLAWRSMCATDEGKEKGEKWCKRAIWGNTLPAVKRIWKNVNNVTSDAFVAMWQQRVSHFYARYSAATAN